MLLVSTMIHNVYMECGGYLEENHLIKCMQSYFRR